MEKCFDEGTLQAFLDNELTPELSQRVARHVAACDPCAELLAEVEEETALVFEALEQEINVLVPTQRLWTKINETIETENRQRSLWHRLTAFVKGLSLLHPQVIAFGSLLLIVGVVSALIVIKPENRAGELANIRSSVPAVTVSQSNPSVDEPPVDTPVPAAAPKIASESAPRAVNANYVPRESNQRVIEKKEPGVQPRAPQFLDGEETYVRTIARLEKTVDSNKDEVMKPSARFSYEKNLAVVNDTISKMKREVRRNPKNDDAKQILFASYQNKIELLNSVTQRSELMASMR
ncbi:MAG: zf-HC2 domain-containing protein [Acidobacteria bacterium]|nr:zf-HC2 domain-containing protein [Acidobacteriota bacterium]